MWVCSSNGPNTTNFLFSLTFYKSLDTEVRDRAFTFSFYILFFLKSPPSPSPSVRLSTRFLPSHCLQLFTDPLLPFLADCSYLFTTSAVMRYGCECSGHINAALISCWLIKMYCVAFIWAVSFSFFFTFRFVFMAAMPNLPGSSETVALFQEKNSQKHGGLLKMSYVFNMCQKPSCHNIQL